MSDDLVFFRQPQADDDHAEFQSAADREALKRELVGHSEDETELETTLKMAFAKRRYWQEIFG